MHAYRTGPPFGFRCSRVRTQSSCRVDGFFRLYCVARLTRVRLCPPSSTPLREPEHQVAAVSSALRGLGRCPVSIPSALKAGSSEKLFVREQQRVPLPVVACARSSSGPRCLFQKFFRPRREVVGNLGFFDAVEVVLFAVVGRASVAVSFSGVQLGRETPSPVFRCPPFGAGSSAAPVSVIGVGRSSKSRIHQSDSRRSSGGCALRHPAPRCWPRQTVLPCRRWLAVDRAGLRSMRVAVVSREAAATCTRDYLVAVILVRTSVPKHRVYAGPRPPEHRVYAERSGSSTIVLMRGKSSISTAKLWKTRRVLGVRSGGRSVGAAASLA